MRHLGTNEMVVDHVGGVLVRLNKKRARRERRCPILLPATAEVGHGRGLELFDGQLVGHLSLPKKKRRIFNNFLRYSLLPSTRWDWRRRRDGVLVLWGIVCTFIF